MANTYKNAKAVGIGTTKTDIYTTPVGASGTVVGLSIANVTSNSITVDVFLYDKTDTTTAYLIKSAPLGVGSSLIVIGGDQKLILESEDKIQVKSSAIASIDVVMSILEAN